MIRYSKLPAIAREVASLFHLSKRDSARVAGLFTEVDVKEGSELAWEGSGVKQLILVLEGEVEVTKDGQTIAILGPGGVLGEITALGVAREQTASAFMRTPGRVAAAGASELHKLKECTGLYLHLQHLASKRTAGVSN